MERPSDMGKLRSSSSLHEVGGGGATTGKKSLKDAERNRKRAASDIGRQREGRYNLLNLLAQYEFIELSLSLDPTGPAKQFGCYRVQRESS